MAEWSTRERHGHSPTLSPGRPRTRWPTPAKRRSSTVWGGGRMKGTPAFPTHFGPTRRRRIVYGETVSAHVAIGDSGGRSPVLRTVPMAAGGAVSRGPDGR